MLQKWKRNILKKWEEIWIYLSCCTFWWAIPLRATRLKPTPLHLQTILIGHQIKSYLSDLAELGKLGSIHAIIQSRLRHVEMNCAKQFNGFCIWWCVCGYEMMDISIYMKWMYIYLVWLWNMKYLFVFIKWLTQTSSHLVPLCFRVAVLQIFLLLQIFAVTES